MKTLLISFLLALCVITNAQVTLTPTLGTLGTTEKATLFVGTELGVPRLSVNIGWLNFRIDKHVFANGIYIGSTLYWWPDCTSPFFKWEIVRYGKNVFSEYTGKPLRSLTLLPGFRYYPWKDYEVWDRLSFDICGGIEIQEKKTLPAATIKINFIFFKPE